MAEPKRCLLFHKWRKNNPCSRTCMKCGLEQHVYGSWNPDDMIRDRWEDIGFDREIVENGRAKI